MSRFEPPITLAARVTKLEAAMEHRSPARPEDAELIAELRAKVAALSHALASLSATVTIEPMIRTTERRLGMLTPRERGLAEHDIARCGMKPKP